jgi:hypothetical protein
MTSPSIEASVHRDLTQVVRHLVSLAVRCGVYEYALFRRAALSAFLMFALGIMLGL